MQAINMRRLLPLLAAGAILAPGYASAQCAFNQATGSTTYTGYLSNSLVRAFVSCNNPGGNTPNATNATGTVPTCYPAENYSQQAGSPANGWEFHPGTSYGRLTIKRTSGGENLAGYPPTVRDAVITLKMYHIGQTSGGGFASGTGNMQILFRATMNDYTFGDMTTIDFPLGLPIQLSGGSGTVSKKLGDVMKDDFHLPRFPDCTSIEIISVSVSDPNGNVFAVSGVKFP